MSAELKHNNPDEYNKNNHFSLNQQRDHAFLMLMKFILGVQKLTQKKENCEVQLLFEIFL